MSGDKMEVEAAEQKMNSLEHSEQHYFKRLVHRYPKSAPSSVAILILTLCDCSYDHHGTI
jgi:hypothetical protein